MAAHNEKAAIDISEKDHDLGFQEARTASSKEHHLSIWQALKLYRKGILWSILLSTAIISEGYDTLLGTSLLAFPAYTQRFGTLTNGTYTISPAWQVALACSAYIGEILGLWATGIIQERYGIRKTVCGALVMLAGFIFISVFGYSLAAQFVGQLLCGIPWGAFQTLTVVYAAEILPLNIRAYLATYVNCCWVIGQLIAAGVLVGFQNTQGDLAWQIPFVLQFVWIPPLFIAVCFCPESPTWLVKKGRFEEAEAAVRRLADTDDPRVPSAKENVALLRKTHDMEMRVQEGTRYHDCLRGTNLRRSEIAVVVWCIQQIPGVPLMSFATVFLTQAGLSSAQAFDLNLGLYALGLVGTILSWFLMKAFGRRTIFLNGLIILFVLMLATGIAGCFNSTAASWSIGGLLLGYTFFYDLTIGPIVYIIVPEASSSSLRIKTTAMARTAYNVVNIVTLVITPYMINENAWNWQGKTGFFYAGAAALCIVWTFFRLPEFKGKTYAELDFLFEQSTPARHFAKAKVDVFEKIEG